MVTFLIERLTKSTGNFLKVNNILAKFKLFPLPLSLQVCFDILMGSYYNWIKKTVSDIFYMYYILSAF